MGAKKSNKDKNAARNARKKAAKAEEKAAPVAPTSVTLTVTEDSADVVYVAAELDMSSMEEFKEFNSSSLVPVLDDGTPDLAATTADSDSDEDDELANTGPSRKAKKALRLSVAELKQLVADPSLVESHDVTSSDPTFLVHLKGLKSAVPVPAHWAQKRKYLQGKRGVEKAAFQLPKFIEDTGISEIRGSTQEDEEKQSAKQKGRARVAPKMGKIDVDYKTLHDAFFKYQTKPAMNGYGELYYEGREFEQDVSVYRPGKVSDELKEALGMSGNVPPPWLVNMQRYGPPPSFPNLKIQGLNAPLPAGASFGFHPGGWGKPPVDAYGRPLYGDVFAKEASEGESDFVYAGDGSVVAKGEWGAKPVGAESDSESEEEEDDEDDDEEEEEGEETADALGDGAASVATTVGGDGTSSVDTSADVQLRKEGGEETPQLYTVLETKEKKAGAGEFFGSSVQYVLPGAKESEEGMESIISKAGSDKRKRADEGGEDSDDDEGDAKKYKF